MRLRTAGILFDSDILDDDPNHYRRTREDAEGAAHILGLVLHAFESGKWMWVQGAPGDWESGHGRVFTLTGAIWHIANGRHELHAPAHSAAVRYLAAWIVQSHGSRSYHVTTKIVRDYNNAEGRTLDEVLAMLNRAYEEARDEAMGDWHSRS